MLTDIRARRIDVADKPLSDGVVPGLYLFPSSKRGTGKWILRYVSPATGKRRDMGMGGYPEVGVANARKASLEARQAIADGADPLELRRAKQEAARNLDAIPPFEDAARRVFEDIRPGFRNRKHAEQWISTLERYVFPAIGSRTVDELRASDFADALRPVWLEKPETASRVRQRCDTVMKWCAARDFIVASPVGVVNKLLARQPGKRERVEHHPAVPWRAVPGVIEIALRTEEPSIGRQALEFLILTAARSGEVRGMTWAETDLETAIWTIPAARMKAKTAHRVPLSARAVEILRTRRSAEPDGALVFPSRRGTPLSDITLSKVLRDARIESDVPGRLATPHGFRSSFRDWASENGYSRDLAERALAHTIRNAAEAAYHRTDLLNARREMMEAWGEFARGTQAHGIEALHSP